VEKTIPTGILSEEIINIDIEEETLFLSKQEVKEQIEKNKKIVEDYEKLKPIQAVAKTSYFSPITNLTIY